MSTLRQRITLNSANDRSVTRLCCENTTLRVSDVVEQRAAVLGEVILRERALAPRVDVVLGVLLHPVEREDSLLRPLQHDLVDVRRIHAAAIVQALLLQEDRHRVHFLARRAPGVPDPDERIGAQQRNHVLAERPVERRDRETSP